MKVTFAATLLFCLATFGPGYANAQGKLLSNEPPARTLACGEQVRVKVSKNVCPSGVQIVIGACAEAPREVAPADKRIV